jgi:hypothetical protein
LQILESVPRSIPDVRMIILKRLLKALHSFLS